MWLLNPYRFGTAELALGQPLGGGFFAGYISHTANGNPTHALIVAPRATGATGPGYASTTPLSSKTTNSTTSSSGSAFDGLSNTLAKVAGGIANHPAAQFCVNLSIGGFTDWYLPAPLELDIAYFNLKPTTTANTTSFGVNEYAVPQRTTNWTTALPAQTAITAFTGAEQFSTSNNHWSSQDGGTFSDVFFAFTTGNRTGTNKTFGLCVRAFRRIAL